MFVMQEYCRSPVAQGVFESVVWREGLQDEILVDSAGTYVFCHAGEPPDPRAQESVHSCGIDISGQRARLLDPEDCRRFAYVLTMDVANYRVVSALCKEGAAVRPFLDFANGTPELEVPDPYQGGSDGFRYVLGLIEEASEGLLQEIRDRHLHG